MHRKWPVILENQVISVVFGMDCKPFCSEIRQKLKEDVAAIKEENVGFKPGLAIVQVWCLIFITELLIKKQC